MVLSRLLKDQIVLKVQYEPRILPAAEEPIFIIYLWLQLNGALTIGTLDGANVEMAEEMGLDNIFIFGMTIDQVEALQAAGYNAQDYVAKNPELARVMEQLGDGTFSKTGNPDEFKDIVNNLLYHDRYYTMADFDAYIAAQDQVNECYRVSWKWAKGSANSSN